MDQVCNCSDTAPLTQLLSDRKIPEISAEMKSLSTRLPFVDTLPAILPHFNLAGQNIFVDKDTDTITGVIDIMPFFGKNKFRSQHIHTGSLLLICFNNKPRHQHPVT